MIGVNRREGESGSALIFRFTKKVKRSGVLPEARKRRFHDRPQNRRKRRLSALHRARRRTEVERLKKLGTI